MLRVAVWVIVTALSAISVNLVRTRGSAGPGRPVGPVVAQGGIGTTSGPAGTVRDRTKALLPAEALAGFVTHPGLKVGVVAAEPQVVDPVAIAFDERLRLYVVEMRGYPDPLGPNYPEPASNPPREGRIALLESTRGDGVYDRRAEFATGLSYPSGVAVWKGGIFVTCAPDIFYLKDTDGDGVADVREVVLTGFSDRYTAHLRVSHPTLGLDGKFYLTSGLMGGSVRSPLHPDLPAVEYKRSDSRFDPATFAFSLTSGHAQFGQTFDDWGRKFVCMNTVPLQHVVFDESLLARNPLLEPISTMVDIPELTNDGRVSPGGSTRLKPVSDNIVNPRFPEQAGRYTAACGVVVYRGSALPAEYYGRTFVCEPVANLVHNDILVPRGTTFVSRPVNEAGEFLASPDNWFRPVFLANGPDGALYVVDMYRKTIEHPAYLPVELRPKTDFVSGRSEGRIYRVTAADFKPPAKLVRAPAEMSVGELFECLSRRDAWWRETAFRLLFERGDEAVRSGAREILAGSKDAWARGCALWLLHDLGVLDTREVQTALIDPEAGVRKIAVQFAAVRVQSEPSLRARLLRMVDDKDPEVRLQVALAMGNFLSLESLQGLARLAVGDSADRWTRLAALSSVGGRLDEFLTALLARADQSPDSPGVIAMLCETAPLVGAGGTNSQCRALAIRVLGRAGEPVTDSQLEALMALGTGLAKREAVAGEVAPLRALLAEGGTTSAANRQRLDEVVQAAGRRAADESAAARNRIFAIKLLSFLDLDALQRIVPALVQPSQRHEVQMAAAGSVAMMRNPRVVRAMVAPERWKDYTPPVRDALLNGFLAQPGLRQELLANLEDGTLPPAAVGSVVRRSLEKSADAAVRERARVIFVQSGTEDRLMIYRRFESSLTLTPDRANGRDIFVQRCVACHRYKDQGGILGPNLTGIGSQPLATILQSIVVPNQDLANGYMTYQIVTQDRRTVYGRLSAESPREVNIVNLAGATEIVPRENIAAMTSSDISLMADGLEAGLTLQGMADLLGFLVAGPPN